MSRRPTSTEESSLWKLAETLRDGKKRGFPSKVDLEALEKSPWAELIGAVLRVTARESSLLVEIERLPPEEAAELSASIVVGYLG